MNLKNQILNNIKIALKQGNKAKLEALRFLFSQIKDIEISQARKALTDDQIVKLISSQIKKLEEANVLYQKAQRNEIVDKNNQEISILKTYLPKQLSDQDLETKVDEIINANKQVINPGTLIGMCVKQLTGKADNHRISAMVMKKMTGKKR